MVWIPRYEYQVKTPETLQEVGVRFIPRNQNEPDAGYIIPEAFAWSDTEGDTSQNKQISGYWISKYEVSGVTAPVIDADFGVGDTSIRIGGIRKLTEENVKLEYYLDGVKKHETNNKDEVYTYTGLAANRKYAINIIARNRTTNAYIAALTKEVTTVGANSPDLTNASGGFNPSTTYYVVYDESGTNIISENVPITQAPPNGWYDYANRKWANIVTTSTDGSKKTYMVWVPRYAYRTVYTDISTAEAYADIVWLRDASQDIPAGYSLPEAFVWSDTEGDTNAVKQIRGYWITKYEVSQ